MVEPCAEDIKMRGKRWQEIKKTFETFHPQTLIAMEVMLGGGGGGTNYENQTLT
jgi:hypothetical protein